MGAFQVHAELAADGDTVYAIPTGDIATAMLLMHTLTPTVSLTRERTALRMALSWPLVVQLATQLGKGYVPGPRLAQWTTDEFVRRTADTGYLLAQSQVQTSPEYRPPPDKTPRAYQWDGMREIARTGRCLIFDEQGTGKSLTAILGCLALHSRPGAVAGPIVVVAPNSVMDSWVTHWREWTTLRAVAWRGSPDRRRGLIGTADVYVVGYGTVRRDAGEARAPLVQLGARTMIIDECHMIKNPTSVQSRSVRRLCRKADSIIAMSGTPITHHTGDLWPTLQAIDAKAWPSGERYRDRYLVTVDQDYGAPTVIGLDPAAEPEFRTVLQGGHRRVAKADVLDQLPPKVYTRIDVDLPAEHRAAYDAMERDMIAQLPQGGELPAMTALSQLIRLNQMASSACDVAIEYVEKINTETGELEEVPAVHVTPRAPSWKVDVLLEKLEERVGKQTLVFAPSKGLISVAGTAAEKAGWRVGYIVGGQSPRERTAAVAAFQAGEVDVIMATTGAGGVGLTLTAADAVIFLQRPWSYVEAVQAEDRAHRIGSERHVSVEIIDIVARDTIDSRVRDVITEKAGSMAELLQDPRIASTLFGGEVTAVIR